MDVTSKLNVFKDFNKTWFQELERKFEGKIITQNHCGTGVSDNRKHWEVISFLRAMEERGCLKKKNKALGFGVGLEMFPSYFASLGMDILATDLPLRNWSTLNFGPDYVYNQDFVSREVFDKRVRVKKSDMNWMKGEGDYEAISDEEETFDFVWSVCSMDHLGSVWNSMRFLYNSLNMLKPGGYAFHSAEYSICPGMARSGPLHVMGPEDVLQIIRDVEVLGHEMSPFDWDLGTHYRDHLLDNTTKIRFQHGWYSCILFIVKKEKSGVVWVDIDRNTAMQDQNMGGWKHDQEHSDLIQRVASPLV